MATADSIFGSPSQTLTDIGAKGERIIDTEGRTVGVTPPGVPGYSVPSRGTTGGGGSGRGRPEAPPQSSATEPQVSVQDQAIADTTGQQAQLQQQRVVQAAVLRQEVRQQAQPRSFQQLEERRTAFRQTVRQKIEKQKPQSERLGERTKKFAFGQAGKQVVGVGQRPVGVSTATPQVTFEKVQTTFRKGGLPGKVAAELIPTTPGEIAIAGGTAAVFPFVPGAVRIPAEVTFGVIGTRQALDIKAAPEKRIAGGILGGLSFAGATFEASPYIKGTLTRFTPRYRKIVKSQQVTPSKLAPKGVSDVIKSIPSATPDESFDIQLISPGKGFGFTQAEQKALIGKRRTITTTARDLVKPGKPTVAQKGEGDLGIFFTPTIEASPKLAQTRISRAGLADLFKITKQPATISFKQEKPQFVVVRDTLITKTGKPGTARGMGFPSSELEVTLLPGTELAGKQVATTALAGQRVQIFEAKIIAAPKITTPPKINIPGLRTSTTPTSTNVVSPTTLPAVSKTISSVVKATTKTQPTVKTTKITPTKISLPTTKPTIPTTKPTTPRRVSGNQSIPTKPIPTPTIPTTPISPPPRKITRPPRVPTTPLRPNVKPIITTKAPQQPKLSFKPFKLPKQPKGRFPVLGRRFGEFKVIGIGKTEGQAFSLGKKFASETLGATFKIPGAKARKLPGFKTKISKKGEILFIEPRSRRIKKRGKSLELPELQQAKKRKVKGGRKKKKKK